MSKFHNPIYEKDRWAANRSKAFLIAVLSVNSVIAVIAIVVFMNMAIYMKTSSEMIMPHCFAISTLAMAECLMIVFIAPALAVELASVRSAKMEIWSCFFIDGCFAMAGDFRKACFLHEYDVCAYATSLPVFHLYLCTVVFRCAILQ